MVTFFILSMAVAMAIYLICEAHLPLLEKPRTWIVNRNPSGMLAYLVSCWWCVSVYVGAAAAIYAVLVLDVIKVHEAFLWSPALSFAGVTLLTITDKLQDQVE